MAAFGGDGGLGAVAGIDGGVAGEGFDEGFKGVDEVPVVAAGKVGAADAELEEAVAVTDLGTVFKSNENITTFDDK